MGEEDLIKALVEETDRKVESIIKEAEEDARISVSDAEREMERIKQERLRALHSGLEKRRDMALNRARARLKGHMLSVREEAIEEVLESALKAISGLERERYLNVIEALYMELREDWPSSDGQSAPTVRVNPGDEDTVKKLAYGDGYEVATDESVEMGVVFVSTDARFKFSNTIGSRLVRLRRELETMIDGRLFG